MSFEARGLLLPLCHLPPLPAPSRTARRFFLSAPGTGGGAGPRAALNSGSYRDGSREVNRTAARSECVEDRPEGLDDNGIELGSAAAVHFQQRFTGGYR